MVSAHVEKQPTAGGALALVDSSGVLRDQQSGRGARNEPDRQVWMVFESAPSPLKPQEIVRFPRRGLGESIAKCGQFSMTIRVEKATLQRFDRLQPGRVSIVRRVEPGSQRLPYLTR